jgi:hypothetical protein
MWMILRVFVFSKSTFISTKVKKYSHSNYFFNEIKSFNAVVAFCNAVVVVCNTATRHFSFGSACGEVATNDVHKRTCGLAIKGQTVNNSVYLYLYNQ